MLGEGFITTARVTSTVMVARIMNMFMTKPKNSNQNCSSNSNHRSTRSDNTIITANGECRDVPSGCQRLPGDACDLEVSSHSSLA